jgi:hypothetical protein
MLSVIKYSSCSVTLEIPGNSTIPHIARKPAKSAPDGSKPDFTAFLIFSHRPLFLFYQHQAPNTIYFLDFFEMPNISDIRRTFGKSTAFLLFAPAISSENIAFFIGIRYNVSRNQPSVETAPASICCQTR